MSNKKMHATASPDPFLVFAPGTISLASGSTGTLSDTIPFASASRLGTGRFRVLFDDKYVSLKCAQLTLETTASLNLSLKVSGSSMSGGYVDFYTGRNVSGSNGASSGFTADDPSGPCTVHALFIFKNSAV